MCNDRCFGESVVEGTIFFSSFSDALRFAASETNWHDGVLHPGNCEKNKDARRRLISDVT